MKKLFVPLFLLFPFLAHAQLPLAGVARFNVSQFFVHDPANSSRTPMRSGLAFTPGFGLAVMPYSQGKLSTFVQVTYQELGADRPYYFATSNSPYVVRLFDRYRCIHFDVMARIQHPKGYFLAAGGSLCRTLKGYFRNNNPGNFPPPGSIILTPESATGFYWSAIADAGINVAGKTDISLSAMFGITPILNRTDAKIVQHAWLFSIRYYFFRPGERQISQENGGNS